MIYDISPPITESIRVWPGDKPFSREVLSRMDQGAAATASVMHATAHLGAHADAPSHFGTGAKAIDEMDLDYYMGSCQVIRLKPERASQITPDHVKTPVVAQRVLFATGSFPNPNEFNEDFAALSPQLVSWLHKKGVKLVGVDTPSIDLYADKDLPSHRAMLDCEMAILEGLLLDQVPDGIYELVALPLRLVGFEASPVRAILRLPEARGTRH